MDMTGGRLEAQLPAGIRSRFVNNHNGLDMHVLEAGFEGGGGFETGGRPVLLLLHGFPELAYSWRKIMLPLAAAGYHVVAPDQRGYGRTTGWDGSYDGDLASFRMQNLVTDIVGLVSALGIHAVAAVVGHDFGSPVAGYCALMRPDMFPAVALLSAPFGSVPSFPFDTAGQPARGPKQAVAGIHEELAALTPPRKHYQGYYSTRAAEGDMLDCPQGLHDFLRAYYHVKSADFKDKPPSPLAAWNAEELGKLPTYYVMEKDKTMPETVAPDMPSADAIAACKWLGDEELRVYCDEYARTGFQGALQWYRCLTEAALMAELRLFSGRTLDVPSCFIAGASDWGIHQKPGEFKAMQQSMCTRLLGCHLVEGAGHWVQQEQPEQVSRLLLEFLQACA
ncbi:alpha/beta fold hydrolase [Undibacterium sp. TJN25]|uniref:alpha/beta hydrolase n=1 Tax=Undibacterium sp. TJN25 TaxID=3413056 RepID=UPI003BF123E1